MNTPQKPKDQPKNAAPAPQPAPQPSPKGDDAEPKGLPTSDRHKTETAAEPPQKG